jgi:integrase/recombinase XerC
MQAYLSTQKLDTTAIRAVDTENNTAYQIAHLLSEWLGDKSPTTVSGYKKDLRLFELDMSVSFFQVLSLPKLEGLKIIRQYKSLLKSKGLQAATINRRLSSLRALATIARASGFSDLDLAAIKSEKVIRYRDTSGIEASQLKQLRLAVDRTTAKGARDLVILGLLIENALRRSELANIAVSDLDLESFKIWITGKGKGSEKTAITISPRVRSDIEAWLGLGLTETHLLIGLVNTRQSCQLSTNTIAQIVKSYCRTIGVTKAMSPHRIRHSAITTALDLTNGNLREVQKLSRHKNLDTLQIYDDCRIDFQGKITNLLSEL